MLGWAEFQHVRPDLAEAGRRLLCQFGVGLAFLATVRADGGPRLHPMCPLVTDDALVGFLQPTRRRAATTQFLAERKLTAAPQDLNTQDLFEFHLERCLWTQTSGHGDWNPRHTIWRSS